MNFITSTLKQLNFNEISFKPGFPKSQPFGNQYFFTPKGNLIIELAGKDQSKTIQITAHIDTIGAKITQVEDNGILLFQCIGDFMLPTVESHYCTIHTFGNKIYSGTIQCKETPLHLFKKTGRELVRKEENMIIELDYQINTKKDAQELGIIPGDYVSFVPNTEINYDSKIIKSRFLDDKTGIAICMSNIAHFINTNKKPLFDTYFVFNSFEELGHPTNYIPFVTEIMVIDAILVGKDLESNINSTFIATNDQKSSYDQNLVKHLLKISKQENIQHKYGYMKNYGTDVSMSHLDVRAGLIGPGVKWMHSVEKTSFVALEETAKLLWAYLTIPEIQE